MSADAIRISMYSLRYIKGTYEAATNAMRYDSPHYDAMRSDFG